MTLTLYIQARASTIWLFRPDLQPSESYLLWHWPFIQARASTIWLFRPDLQPPSESYLLWHWPFIQTRASTIWLVLGRIFNHPNLIYCDTDPLYRPEPQPSDCLGQIFNHTNGSDVYHGVPKDYTCTNVNPKVFLQVVNDEKINLQILLCFC